MRECSCLLDTLFSFPLDVYSEVGLLRTFHLSENPQTVLERRGLVMVHLEKYWEKSGGFQSLRYNHPLKGELCSLYTCPVLSI